MLPILLDNPHSSNFTFSGNGLITYFDGLSSADLPPIPLETFSARNEWHYAVPLVISGLDKTPLLEMTFDYSELVKNQILNKLFSIPDFKEAHDINDIPKMSELYRTHVLIPKGSEKGYFEDINFSLLTDYKIDRITGPLELVLPEVAKRVKYKIDQYVEENLRLVYHIAKGYEGLRVPEDDLIQNGNLGLIFAACKFDESRGIRFSTYACNCIKGFIYEELEKRFAGQLTPAQLSIYCKYNRVKERLTKEYAREPNIEEIIHQLQILYKPAIEAKLKRYYGRDPTEQQISERLNNLTNTIRELRENLKKRTTSLNKLVGNSQDGEELGNLITGQSEGVSDDLQNSELRKRVEAQIEDSIEHPQIKEILLRKLGLGGHQEQDLKEIAQNLGITFNKAKALLQSGMRILQSGLSDLDPNNREAEESTSRAEFHQPRHRKLLAERSPVLVSKKNNAEAESPLQKTGSQAHLEIIRAKFIGHRAYSQITRAIDDMETQVVMLLKIQSKTNEQIAQMLGISTEKVKQLLQEGKSILKRSRNPKKAA